VHGLHLLSCSREGHALEASTVESVVAGARRAFDLVILDVPRGLDDAVLSAVRQAGTTLLVVPADVRGVAAGHALACAVGEHCPDLLVVPRTGNGLGLDPEEVADAVGFPRIAELRDDARAAAGYERGDAPSLRPRGPWSAPVDAVLGHLPRQSLWPRAS
jgi:MinD superfamily P-loop ATPase